MQVVKGQRLALLQRMLLLLTTALIGSLVLTIDQAECFQVGPHIATAGRNHAAGGAATSAPSRSYYPSSSFVFDHTITPQQLVVQRSRKTELDSAYPVAERISSALDFGPASGGRFRFIFWQRGGGGLGRNAGTALRMNLRSIFFVFGGFGRNNNNKRNENREQGSDREHGATDRGRRGRRGLGGTALRMGIRSMFGGFRKRGGRNKRDNDDEDYGDGARTMNGEKQSSKQANIAAAKSASAQSAAAATAARGSLFPGGGHSPPSPSSAPPPLRMGENPLTKEVDVHSTIDHKESVQERINRVKSGKMTEFEKQAFLQTALTAGNTAESRKPLLDGTKESSEKKKIFASPFPTDSILRNFVSGGKQAVSAEEKLLSSQKKKREYLDMVTNPNRFNRYRLPERGDGGHASPPDLGARLGAAALVNENLRQQKQKQQLERKRRSEEETKKRQVEVRQFEFRQAERKKLFDTKRQQEEDEKDRAERERLEQLIKAQEEYWNKKLAKERSARAKRAAVDKKGDDDDDKDSEEAATATRTKVDVTDERKSSSDDIDKAKAVSAAKKTPLSPEKKLEEASAIMDKSLNGRKQQQQKSFNPDESDLLSSNEVRNNGRLINFRI